MSITKEQVLDMKDFATIQAAIKNPETAADMQQLLRDRKVVSHVSNLMLEAQNREAAVDAEIARTIPPSTDQLAAEATAMAAAEPVTTPSATPNAPAAELTPVTSAPIKIVREYQVRDEDGTAIGRPTHLEAWSMEEMLEKMQTAHENATRAFHRLKKQKLTFKADRTILTPEQISEAAKAALEVKDPAKVTEVIHEVIESTYKTREQELKNQEDFQRGRSISNEFMRRHLHDYNPCEANQKAIGDYFTEHQLEFTLDNLEAAFQDLKEQGNKLAPVQTVATRQAPEAANPAPVATVAAPAPPAIPVAEPTATVPASEPLQPAAVVSQPLAAETTHTTPAAAPNVQPAARRAGVNGSLPPGSLSAQRPGAPDPVLARKEFLKTVKAMDPKVMQKKIATDPQFVKTLESYGIRVR